MWSFLSNLGSGLARIGSGFAHGAASVGKGIGRGVGRLGHLASGEDLEPSGPGGTPGINPNAGYPGLTPGINPAAARGVRGVEEIGRASCRERVEVSGVGGAGRTTQPDKTK